MRIVGKQLKLLKKLIDTILIRTMKKYKNNHTGQIVELIAYDVAGMGHLLLGKTLVLYKNENQSNTYPYFISLLEEFFKTHSEII